MSHDIAILGDGCAALSLARRSKELDDCQITIVRPTNAPQAKDHVWGFWSDPVLTPATNIARKTWQKWAIITPDDCAVLSSSTRPYNAFKRSDWLSDCTEVAKSSGVKIIDEAEMHDDDYSQIFDTRPPICPEGNVLQHFLGLEIKTKQPVFDPEIAILMDFRVDQSKGMHFVYLLPYSETEALVESTIFSTKIANEEFYKNSITDYLKDCFKVLSYEITHQEKGVIPLGKLAPHDPNIPGLGANGGATRPASGYAFVFIQQQINDAIERTTQGKELIFKNPHKKLDLWMDSVLLTVLKNWPEHGPNMFLRMGKSLTGDQFVRFLSGQASWWIRAKVVLSMPKIPFLKAITKRVFSRKKSTNAVVA